MSSRRLSSCRRISKRGSSEHRRLYGPILAAATIAAAPIHAQLEVDMDFKFARSVPVVTHGTSPSRAGYRAAAASLTGPFTSPAASRLTHD